MTHFFEESFPINTDDGVSLDQSNCSLQFSFIEMSKLLLSISVFVAVLVAASASTSDLDLKWAEFKVIHFIRRH
jgi:hypothetical protein